MVTVVPRGNVTIAEVSFHGRSGETDPNKLHDLQADLDAHAVYRPDQIDELAALYLRGAGREVLDVILDACADVYERDLDEDEQVDFKGKAKAFLRTYGFLRTILPWPTGRNAPSSSPSWCPSSRRPRRRTPRRASWTRSTWTATGRRGQNARANSDSANARVEHDHALDRVMTSILQDDTQLFKHFSDDPDFKRWLVDRIFEITYRAEAS